MAGKVLHSKPQAHKDEYTFRWVVGKQTGEGEQSSVEVIANPQELGPMVEMAYRYMDLRMLIQNQRLQDFMEISKGLPPEVQMKVRQCVDVAFGLASLKDLERVKQDAAEMDADNRDNPPHERVERAPAVNEQGETEDEAWRDPESLQ